MQTIQEIENHGDACEIDSQIAPQALNCSDALYVLRIQHDRVSGHFGRLYQPAVQESAHKVRMNVEVSGNLFEMHQVAPVPHDGECVCRGHRLPPDSVASISYS